ncbi:Gas vesicle synthesis protein GvpO [Gracilibacillus ureilyticus]|uniref:Gas vesicle synthesis protein GvpO n=1 Tax=Gracilibacillus ureilyticus TaxID=531814 RepID=A0A1H9PA45_9BACI|nr:gas vesicle protein GvpO [Gracilibacillus ureilyticus]SER45124.1 Gas vesicle synthesis protein GvpO [Gracilibacillus ureilyticus]
MKIKEIMKNVNDFFQENVAPPHKITSVERLEEGGWRIKIEVIEEKEYMKRYAKDEMIGTYEVLVDEDQEITAYKRQEIRYRSSVGVES